MSAYFLFLNGNREKIKEENPGIAFTDIAKKGSEMWNKLEDKTVSTSASFLKLDSCYLNLYGNFYDIFLSSDYKENKFDPLIMGLKFLEKPRRGDI